MRPENLVDPHLSRIESRIVQRLELADVDMIRSNRNQLFMSASQGRRVLVDNPTRMHTSRFSISEIHETGIEALTTVPE